VGSFSTRVRGIESVQTRLAPIKGWQSAHMLPLTQVSKHKPSTHTHTHPARPHTQPACSMDWGGLDPLGRAQPRPSAPLIPPSRRCPHQATEGRPLYVVLLRCC
jgi:hypothetical protein